MRRPLRIGVLGDFHGPTKRPALRLFCAQTRPDILLSVGDLQDYEPYPVPLLFVRGNHEDYAAIAGMERSGEHARNINYLPDRTIVDIAGLNVAGVGGQWADPPRPTPKDIDPAALEWLGRQSGLDLVVSHDTPIAYPGRPDLVRDELRLVCEVLGPRFWFSGHHHRFAIEQLGRTTIVSLGRWPHEWGVLELDESGDLAFERFRPDPTSGYHALLPGWRAAADVDRGRINTGAR